MAKRDGEAEVDIGGRPFRIRKQFLEDISRSKLRDSVARLGKALLVMHSPRDTVVGIERSIRLEGPLGEEQRTKLLEISNKCPVHRTLHSKVTIPTRLAD